MERPVLYPQENETRELKDLSGIWRFRVDVRQEGMEQEWFHAPLTGTMPMPVPASYNDITQDPIVREHIGDVWYERRFFIPAAWRDRSVCIHFGSATHHAVVWMNGRQVVAHKGGYLPFHADISDTVRFGMENRMTVKVNNVLDWTTLPPGRIGTFDATTTPPDHLQKFGRGMHPEDGKVQEYYHDFFHYSGLHRPVRLVALPRTHIADVTVVTDIRDTSGVVHFRILLSGQASCRADVRVCDAEGRDVAQGEGLDGCLDIPNAQFWQPGLPYLYTLRVHTYDENGQLEDCYRLPFGIRTVSIQGKQFLINGKPFYFKGFGKHEDMDIKGKGLDPAVNVKDMNLLKWIGANSFRTSHYPYAEELLYLADQEGIVVIDESPAVGLNFHDPNRTVFEKDKVNEETLHHHLDVMRELVMRDKNHPCVVMWAVANEAATHEAGAEPYFRKVAEYTRTLDACRPITIVNDSGPLACRVAQFFDVICVNRYFAWYSDAGRLDIIEHQLERDLKAWHERFRMPVLVTEYGADTIAGLHHDPPVMFSEEFQCAFLQCYHRVFDRLDFVIGEHVWNFADFATKQGITRVSGNRKGVFTRTRQPKAAAHLLQRRWRQPPSL